MGMARGRCRGRGDSRTVEGSMLCARAKRRSDEVGTVDAMKWEAALWIGTRVVAKTDFSPQEQTSRWRVVGQSSETDQPAQSAMSRMKTRLQDSPLNSAHHQPRSRTSLLQSNPPSASLAPTPRSAALPIGLCGRQGLVAARSPLTWADPVWASGPIARWRICAAGRPYLCAGSAAV